MITWQTREQLPEILNKLGLVGVGVEVGVQWAQFFSRIRDKWKGLKLYGVDAWAPYFGAEVSAEQHEHIYKSALETMAPYAAETWKFLRMSSGAAAKFMEHGISANNQPLLDFVFLDADHNYDGVTADLQAWWPLVKPGGIIAGHDWILDGWHMNEQPFRSYPTKEELPQGANCGPFYVRKAVADFFGPLSLLESMAVTAPETDLGWQSWLIRKPVNA